MGVRAFAVAVALIVVGLIVATAVSPGSPGESGGPTASTSDIASSSGPAGEATGSPPPGTTLPRSATSPGPSSPYTFDDEFDGPTLDPAWQRHFTCCGDLAGLDPSLTTLQDGFLSMAVEQRAGGWFGDLIDTKDSFNQRYGLFEARIKIPKGTGLWPAFWGYFAGGGTQAEIDTMEVCGGQAAGGSVLHNSVYWSQHESLSHPTATADLSQDFHVYAVDWRADHLTFLLDGKPVWDFPDVPHIPSVALPVILDLGVGGSFCGPPDPSTPSHAEMLVDWVHVSP